MIMECYSTTGHRRETSGLILAWAAGGAVRLRREHGCRTACQLGGVGASRPGPVGASWAFIWATWRLALGQSRASPSCERAGSRGSAGDASPPRRALMLTSCDPILELHSGAKL